MQTLEPDAPPADTTFITTDTELPGAELIQLRSASGTVLLIKGCLVAQGLACSVNAGHGIPGCGAENAMALVRYPLRGLNLPGEQITGLLEYCSVCGPGLPRLVTPTPQEIADGWAPGTVS